MNLRNISRVFSALFLTTFLFLGSCSSDDGLNLDNELELRTEEVEEIVLADDISTEVEEVLEDDALDVDLSSKGSTSSSVAPCVTRTVETTATSKIVTLDFGDGCETKRGKVLKGKIIITYVKTDTGHSKSVSFEAFSVNDNTVEGGFSAEKIKENTNGNPQSTITVDVKITMTSGVEISRKGEKVREMIEGADTRERGDDVFSISGNWESVNRDGVVKTAEITTNLIRKFACKFIVSGVVELSKNDRIYTLDFGDGECDNKATLTDSEGNTKEITLRR
ncbi:conserved protein of unknown function [Tenacibaculum sp. 190130A14a]|uniref:Lipoprotein n=1 Tax=Tenacibaculum polynesiense TaxID=3137857 RepID=A0ABP1EW30_9FLAO